MSDTTRIRYDSDTATTADRINAAIGHTGRRAVATWDHTGSPGLWLVEHGRPTASGRKVRAGEQVVIDGDTWRVEAATETAVAA